MGRKKESKRKGGGEREKLNERYIVCLTERKNSNLQSSLLRCGTSSILIGHPMRIELTRVG